VNLKHAKLRAEIGQFILGERLPAKQQDTRLFPLQPQPFDGVGPERLPKLKPLDLPSKASTDGSCAEVHDRHPLIAIAKLR
jgi:hypothetical protein